MKSSRRHQFLLFFVFLLTTPPGVICGQNLLVNGGFEEPGGFTNYALLNENVFPGWDTEGADSLIEIWQNGFEEYSYGPVPAYEGGYFAEVNGTSNIGFYQDFITPETGFLDYSFAHRGRLGVDTMRVDITYFGLDGTFGTADDVLLVDGSLAANQYSADNTGWIYTQIDDAFTSVAGGNYRISFLAAAHATPDDAIGNFVDSVVVTVPEPSGVILMGAAGLLALLHRRRTT